MPLASARRTARSALRTLLAFLWAGLAMYAVNLLGAVSAAMVGLGAGGDLRLGWDLGWFLLACGIAAWGVARWSPRAPRWHVAVLLGLLLLAWAYAVWQAGTDWPNWFNAALLAGMPAATAVGTRLALRRRRAST